MKLYRYTVGMTDTYGVAENEQDAYNRRAEIDHTFNFLPVVIEEVKIKGYVIQAMPEKETPQFDKLDRDGLKKWLKDHNIEFTPQWGEEKLRELALQHA